MRLTSKAVISVPMIMALGSYALLSLLIFGTAPFLLAGGQSSESAGPFKLTASDGAEHDNFGASSSISNDTIVVGAPLDDDLGSKSGSAYVYVRTAGGWSQQAKLTASDGGPPDVFGTSVAIDNDTIVVGAQWYEDADWINRGSAYVFVRSGDTWTEQAQLTGSDHLVHELFGAAVAINGDTIVVGTPGLAAPAAYVFVRDDSIWTEEAKLTASDGEQWDFFGESVSISRNTILVGAEGDDNNRGSAYIFTRSETTWSQQAKLTASDGEDGHLFGRSTSIDGDLAVVGAGDSAYVYLRDETAWTQEAKLIAPDRDRPYGDVSFGFSVGINGEVIIAGMPHDSRREPSFVAGGAYIFSRVGTPGARIWNEQAELLEPDLQEYGWFGGSVAISGNTVVVGAKISEGNEPQSGAAFVFPTTPTIGPSGEYIWRGACATNNWHTTCPVVQSNWVDPIGTPWDTPPGDVGDEVVTIGNATVIIDERPVTIESLVAAGSLIVRQDLTLAGDSGIESLTLLADAMLSTNGELTLSGNSRWEDGWIIGDPEAVDLGTSSVVVLPGSELTITPPESGGGSHLLHTRLINRGTVEHEEGELSLSHRLTNEAGAVYSIKEGSLIGTSVLVNRGVFRKTSAALGEGNPGAATIDVFFENEGGGDIDVVAGELSLTRGGMFAGPGSLQVSQGAILRLVDVVGTYEFNGEYSAEGAGEIEFGANLLRIVDGTLTTNVTGTNGFDIKGAVLDIAAGRMINDGLVRLGGQSEIEGNGTFRNNGEFQLVGEEIKRIETLFVNNGEVLLPGSSIFLDGATIENRDGSRFQVTGNSLLSGNAEASFKNLGGEFEVGDFFNPIGTSWDIEVDFYQQDGVFVTVGGTVNMKKPFNVSGGSVLLLGVSTLNVAGGGENSGEGGFAIGSDAKLILDSTGNVFSGMYSVAGEGDFIIQDGSDLTVASGRFSVTLQTEAGGFIIDDNNIDLGQARRTITISDGAELDNYGRVEWKAGVISGLGTFLHFHDFARSLDEPKFFIVGEAGDLHVMESIHFENNASVEQQRADLHFRAGALLDNKGTYAQMGERTDLLNWEGLITLGGDSSIENDGLYEQNAPIVASNEERGVIKNSNSYRILGLSNPFGGTLEFLNTNSGTLSVSNPGAGIDWSVAPLDNQGALIVDADTNLDIFQSPQFEEIHPLFPWTTVTGGTWVVKDGAKLDVLLVSDGQITRNEAQITLEGSGEWVDLSEGLVTPEGFSGPLSVENQTGEPFINSGSFSLMGGATFLTSGDWVNSGLLLLDAASSLSVNGSYTETTGGRSTLLGSLNAQRVVVTTGGTLRSGGIIDSDVQNSGLVGPGGDGAEGAPTTGVLTVNGNYTQTSTGVLEIEMGGLVSGDHDQLVVSGDASLDGTLRVLTANDFVPLPGNEFLIIASAAHSGNLVEVSNNTPFAGLVFDIRYDETPGSSGTTLVADAALMGDANIDGAVNSEDLYIITRSFGTCDEGTWLDGNFDNDGCIDVLDIVKAAFNIGRAVGESD